ncbi:MAG: class I SAM-dependent methyltransferase [Acidimicrobiia bacterium]
MTDFDAYADSYRTAVSHSIAFSGQEHDYFTRRKAEHLVDVAGRLLSAPAELSVLDVGCGVGTTDEFLADHFGELRGVDTAGEAVTRAAARNPTAHYGAYDGRVLPFPDGRFDLTFAICVAHHVAPIDRPSLAAELRRVVRPGGLVVVFEHNPFNPLTRVAVSRCEFDQGVVLLTRRSTVRLLRATGLDPVEARYIIFLTSDRPRARAVERRLRWLPFGAQHYVAARR